MVSDIANRRASGDQGLEMKMVKLTEQGAITAHYTSRALAEALLIIISVAPRGESKSRQSRFLANDRAATLRRAREAVANTPTEESYLRAVAFLKRARKTAGLLEFHGSAERNATARVLLAARDLYRESSKYLALALAMGASKRDVAIAGLTAATRFSMAATAIELLEADGWRKVDTAAENNLEARLWWPANNS